MYRHSPKLYPELSKVFVVTIVLLTGFVYADSLSAREQADSEGIPHVGDKARENYLQYKYAGNNRAFAIAPGGAWAWRSGASNEAEAKQLALQECQRYTQQKCVLYALNNRVVFDTVQWPTLWGPYMDSQTAATVGVGTAVGERFHDLVWIDANGHKVSLSSLRGKLVFLHFWGSWCPPCLREFPSLKKIHAKIKTGFSSDVEMVMLQMREPFETSRAWSEQHEFSDLPLYDSGVKDSEVTALTLSDGSSIQDRKLARVFPSSYVLDRNGVVIFSHHGPVDDWLEYLPFLKHAMTKTERNSKAIKQLAVER